MIQGVIFDMDGTMFDTERIWGSFWKPALAAHGLPYIEGLDEAMRGTAGESSQRVMHRFYGADCDVDAVLNTLRQIATTAFAAAPVPKKPGLDALLAYLKERGLPMAVASSSEEVIIRSNLEHWNMTHYFQAIVAGDHVACSKPDPQIFLLAAQQLGVQPANCLVLEDSYNGVRAGAAGGFVTVMIPDIEPANDEMRRLYTRECTSLEEVLHLLQAGRL